MSLGKSTYVFGATEPSRTTWLVRILALPLDRKSTRLNSSHLVISYAVFCLKKNILKAVTFQKDLGSYYQKTERVAPLPKKLAEDLSDEGLHVDVESTSDATCLCNSDLTAEL